MNPSSPRPQRLVLLSLFTVAALAFGAPSFAKHGADDPPGDDRGGTGDPTGGNAPRSKNGVFKFDQRSFSVSEGAGSARIVIERSKGQRGAVSVDYAVLPGSARAGADFRAVSGKLTWAAGDGLNKTFSIPLTDDSLAEGNETIRLVLSNPTGGAILDAVRWQATLVILDNDGATRCTAGDLCLQSGRFAVSIETTGGTFAVAQSAEAGTFERAAGSPEWLVRVEDTCASSGHFTFHLAEATSQAYRLTVVDTWTGLTKQFGRGADLFVAGRDTKTFGCR